jgi:hypothetical protein
LDITTMPVRQIIADVLLSVGPSRLPAVIIWSERPAWEMEKGDEDGMSPNVVALLRHYERVAYFDSERIPGAKVATPCCGLCQARPVVESCVHVYVRAVDYTQPQGLRLV